MYCTRCEKPGLTSPLQLINGARKFRTMHKSRDSWKGRCKLQLLHLFPVKIILLNSTSKNKVDILGGFCARVGLGFLSSEMKMSFILFEKLMLSKKYINWKASDIKKLFLWLASASIFGKVAQPSLIVLQCNDSLTCSLGWATCNFFGFLCCFRQLIL